MVHLTKSIASSFSLEILISQILLNFHPKTGDAEDLLQHQLTSLLMNITHEKCIGPRSVIFKNKNEQDFLLENQYLIYLTWMLCRKKTIPQIPNCFSKDNMNSVFLRGIPKRLVPSNFECFSSFHIQ